jgi:hypothetical protein
MMRNKRTRDNENLMDKLYEEELEKEEEQRITRVEEQNENKNEEREEREGNKKKPTPLKHLYQNQPVNLGKYKNYSDFIQFKN